MSGKSEVHTVNEILGWIMRYEKNLVVVDRGAKPDAMLDVEYDKYVPREVLMAGQNATIRDIRKAKELLAEANNDYKDACKLYTDYITNDKDISFTKQEDLPF